MLALEICQETWREKIVANTEEPSLKAVRGGEDEVGGRLPLCCDCDSESKVNSELPPPAPPIFHESATRESAGQ